MTSDPSKIHGVPEKSRSENTEVKYSKKFENSKEVKEAAVGKEAFAEAVDFNESAETTGKVSETLGKVGEDKGGVIGGAKGKIYDPAQIKANLLKSIPSERAMKHQIEREIKKEIKYLHKKAVKMFTSPGRVNYFEMSNLMKKIRELKGILIILAKATLESLKTLWLRFVHGVM